MFVGSHYAVQDWILLVSILFSYFKQHYRVFSILIMYFAKFFIFCLLSVFIRWPHFRVSRTFVFTHYALLEQILSSVCILFSYDNHISVCLVCLFVRIMLFKTEFCRLVFCFRTVTALSCVSHACFRTSYSVDVCLFHDVLSSVLCALHFTILFHLGTLNKFAHGLAWCLGRHKSVFYLILKRLHLVGSILGSRLGLESWWKRFR